MNISEILAGSTTTSVDEQKEVLDQMKEQKIFDLNDSERANLINFLCEVSDQELAVDYLYHVLDEEISFPMNDDEKVKKLFGDERMRKLKDLMTENLDKEDDEEQTEELS